MMTVAVRDEMSHIGRFSPVVSAVVMAPPDSMLPFLAAAARDARQERDRLQVHIAAELRVNEATINRFEKGKHWPRNPDRMIGAYAKDLGINAREIWEDALERWRTGA